MNEGLLGVPRCSSMAWTIWCLGSQAHPFICHIIPFSSSKSKSHKVLWGADVCPHHDASKDTHVSCALPAPLPASISTSGHAGCASATLSPRWPDTSAPVHLCPFEAEQGASEGTHEMIPTAQAEAQLWLGTSSEVQLICIVHLPRLL